MRVSGKIMRRCVRRRGRDAVRFAGLGLLLVSLVIGECLPLMATPAWAATRDAGVSEPPTHPATSAGRLAVEALARLPLRFEARDRTGSGPFLARVGDCNIYLTATEAALDWHLSGGVGRLGCGADLGVPRNAGSLDANEQLPGPRRDRAAPRAPLTDRAPAASLRMQLAGANCRARLTGEGTPATTTSYITGNDPKQWLTGVPTYASVKADNVYPGVGVTYYGNGREFEYDFDVAAGADPAVIRLRFSGASRVALDQAGGLCVETPAGQVRHQRPFAYQEINGSRRQVACRFVERRRHEVGFALGPYDRTRPLVIDPVLEFASLLQGGDAKAVALDAAGNIYLAGSAFSSCYPTTSGVVQPSPANNADAFIAKLDPTGTTLIYSTYLGGSNFDEAKGIAVDAAGNAYVTGRTQSANFPTTAGAFKAAPVAPCFGQPSDAFVAKLNPAGTALVYSTYLGGCGDETAAAIAVDAAGNAYVGGSTTSRNFPVRNAPQSEFAEGVCFFTDVGVPCADGFITKLNAAGSALVYSTFIGGHNYDRVSALTLDGEENIYAAGETFSTDFPVTAGSVQSAYRGSGKHGDAFALKLNAAGSALVYSTYLGGSGADAARGIAVDAAGDAYLVGDTASTDFPTTPQALQPHNASASFYKTTNGGIAWNAEGTLPTTPEITTFALDPTAPGTLYAGMSGLVGGGVAGLLYKSTDGGRTWQVKLSVFDGAIDIVAVSPTSPVTVYAASHGPFSVQLYKSTDGGANWTTSPIVVGELTGQIANLVVDPQNASTLYAITSGVPGLGVGVIKSTDGGLTWQVASNGLPVTNNGPTALAIDPNHPATLYAKLNNATYRTTDGGLSWGRVDSLASFNSMVFSAADASLIYAATDGGLFRSVNGGKKWKRVEGNGLPPIGFLNVQLDPATPTTLYLTGSTGTIFKSTNGGARWTTAGAGLPQAKGSLLGIDPRSPATLYARSGGGNDAFIARLNADGSALVFSTYVGGSGNESVGGIALDRSGNVYVAGATASADYPTKEALQSGPHSHELGVDSMFVTKLSGDGAALAYSTYLGLGMPYSVAIDAMGNAHIAGVTYDASTLVAAVTPQKFTACPAVGSLRQSFVLKITDAAAGVPAPRVLRVTPTGGSTAGGTEITITGSGFLPGAAVRIGSVTASNVRVLSATTIQAVTPPVAATLQRLDLTVINPDSQSNTLVEAFTYVPPPVIGRATIVGKDLILLGSNFNAASVILLNGVRQDTTLRVLETGGVSLVGKKLGKRIKPGETVTLHVQNSDGQTSVPFTFTRPPQ